MSRICHLDPLLDAARDVLESFDSAVINKEHFELDRIVAAHFMQVVFTVRELFSCILLHDVLLWVG